MKFHKLVRSIDYATYPVLVELRKINKTLGNSLSSFRDILISAVVGVLLDVSPVSRFIIEKVFRDSGCHYLIEFSNYTDAKTIITIFLAGAVYCVLWMWHFVKVRLRSNKNTIAERKEITFEFYKVIIPNLISLKSMIEQADAAEDDEDKRVLLLLQAKYEVESLIHLLSHINVIEVDSGTNLLTKNSRDVLDQIGSDAYFTVLIDIVDRVGDVFSKLESCKKKCVSDALNSIQSNFCSANVLSIHSTLCLNHPLSRCLASKYEEVKKKMRQRNNPVNNTTTHSLPL